MTVVLRCLMLTNAREGPRDNAECMCYTDKNHQKCRQAPGTSTIIDYYAVFIRSITNDAKSESTCNVFTILQEKLGMRKLLSKWISRVLTQDQKQ